MIHFLCGFKLNIAGSNAKNSAITDHLIISGAETYKQPDTVTYGEIPTSLQGNLQRPRSSGDIGQSQ